jgi:PAS domain S-box-containing protein
MAAKIKIGASKSISLHSKAEKLLSKHPQRTPKISQADTEKLIHELQVHQIELEMQNDELRRKQEKIEESRSRYVDLYDFAPIIYFIFDRKRRIIEANLTGAGLLGVPRSRLVGRPFTAFLDEESINPFLRHMTEVFSSSAKQFCELRIHRQKPEKPLIYVSFESVAVGSGEDTRCRSAGIDITERKLAEEKALRVHRELAKVNDQLRHLSSRLLTVQEEERGRFASEVHDSFASSLAAIKYKLYQALGKAERKDVLDNLVNQLEVAIGEALRIQKALRPPVLDDLGISPALNWLCREFNMTYSHINIEKQFHLEEREIPKSIKIPIFRIAQEAFDNITKHSKADSVSLSLAKTDSSIDFVIRDNGQGFDVEEILSEEGARQSLGLLSMKERARLSGGIFKIESASGKGTTLRVSWPSA